MNNERNLSLIGLKDPIKGGREFADLVAKPDRKEPVTDDEFKAGAESCADAHTSRMQESGLFKPGYLKLYRDTFIQAAVRRWNELDGDGLVIHPDCPPGAMVMGNDGKPRITNYGIGLLAARMACDECENEEEALVFFAGKLAARHSYFKRQNYPDELINQLQKAAYDAGTMEIRQHFNATCHKGGRA